MADKAAQRTFQIQTGLNRPTYSLHPAPTGAPALGIVLAPGAAAWGAYADIIAANAITVEFWLMAALWNLSAGVHRLREVQIYNATTTTTLCTFRVICTAATVNLPPFPFPIPVYCAPNAQIRARAGAANAADEISASLLVATGL